MGRLNTIKKRGDKMSEGKQIAIFMQPKDIERLDRLDEWVTPLHKNRSQIVQEALRFADLRLADFRKFVKSQEVRKCQ